jgi:CubicO group peptidase (beta-lactamase class C family)
LGQFIPDIAENCRDISIRNLLLHYSGLENEPIQAVISRYSIDDYIRNFVKRNISSNPKFNYNNVDYVLLSKVVERATGQTFAQSITDLILKPTKMDDTGFVDEQAIIKDLAYGYHNYSFGEGDKGDPLFNDSRYISNYRGAGGMYATAADLYKFLQAIKNNQLISEETKQQFLLSRQSEDYIDWLSGTPTVGLYVDAEKAVFRRSGSIDGFNSQIIISRNFDKLLIILCNTDTADLDSLADRLYFEK